MEGIDKIPNKEIAPKWVRPNLENERGELERVVSGFLQEEVGANNIERLLMLLETSPITELSEQDWEELENTDSFHDLTIGDVEKAESIADTYNRDLKEVDRRDFKKLLESFQQNKEMECPLIVRSKQGRIHLVSGNTRLMICRVLGLRPKVIIGVFD